MLRRAFLRKSSPVQHRSLIFSLVGVLAALAASGRSEAGTTFMVAEGWDLFETVPVETQFTGLGPLMGVPLGTYDFDTTFGRNIGVQNVGLTDTIIERDGVAIAPTQTAGASATIPIAMDRLQLETVSPVNFAGNGVANYYITLNPTVASTGTMTITWNSTGLGGTFSSTLDVNFEIHMGALNGAVVDTGSLTLTSSGTSWSDLPPPGAFQITNANQFLSGTAGDRTQDFWPVPPFTEQEPGATHVVTDTSNGTIPEPASLVLLGSGILGIGALTWRRRLRAA